MGRITFFLLAFLVFNSSSANLGADDGAKTSLSPAENPPQILVAEAIDTDRHLVLVSYHSIFIGCSGESYNERITTRSSLNGVQIWTTSGKEITLAEAQARLSPDTPIVVTSYKAKLPEFYSKLFAPETLHFAFPARAPQGKKMEAPEVKVQ